APHLGNPTKPSRNNRTRSRHGFYDHGWKNIAGALPVRYRSESKDIGNSQFLDHRSLGQRAKQLNSGWELQHVDLCLKIVPQRTVADYFAVEIESTSRQLPASIDEIFESFERDKPADADDARDWVCRRGKRHRKKLQIDAVVDPVNFPGGIRAPLAKQLTAVISFSRDKLSGGADFTQELIVTEVLHEILSVCRNTKRNFRNFFQENGRVRCPISEVHMKMIDAVAREKVREVERIARALFGLEARAVFLLVLIDKRARPFAGRLRVFLPNL